MAASEQVIYAFSDCSHPNSQLIADHIGNLYGTTSGGGVYNNGCVFQLSPQPDGSWSETLLYSFNGTDGRAPYAAPVFDRAGNLYGTTVAGGAYDGGVVYELSPSPSGEWTGTVLHNFTWSEGNSLQGDLILDDAGNLYGTTNSGGVHSGGTVFELSPGPNGWTLTTLHSFWRRSGGTAPVGGLVMDQTGNLYGVTVVGGKYGYGSAYQLRPQNGGYVERLIHSFNGYDGALPGSGLVMGPYGDLYGVTTFGGTVVCGTLFQLKKERNGKWSESVLYSLTGDDGCQAAGPVAFDGLGNLYAAASYGAFLAQGSIFKLTPKRDGSWTPIMVHRFHYLNAHYKPGIDGANPYAGVIVNQGVVYGTTLSGGVNDEGTVFSITPP